MNNTLEENLEKDKNFINIDSWEFSDGKDSEDVEYVSISRDGDILKFKVVYKDQTETEWNDIETKDHFDRFGTILKLKSKFGQDKIKEIN
jgi:hypothetical protein